MDANILTLKKDVRIVLGENENIAQLLEDAGVNDDQLALERDEMIESMICKAIDKVHLLAPLAMLSDVANLHSYLKTNASVTTDDFGSMVGLDTNFLRMISAKCSNWEKDVWNPIDQDNEAYAWQRAEFAGVRASKRFPVVAIVPDSISGGLRLEAYPKLKEDTDKLYLSVVNMASLPTTIAETSTIKIAKRCYYAVVYEIASMYYISINEREKAALMANEAAEALGMKTKAE